MPKMYLCLRDKKKLGIILATLAFQSPTNDMDTSDPRATHRNFYRFIRGASPSLIMRGGFFAI